MMQKALEDRGGGANRRRQLRVDRVARPGFDAEGDAQLPGGRLLDQAGIRSRRWRDLETVAGLRPVTEVEQQRRVPHGPRQHESGGEAKKRCIGGWSPGHAAAGRLQADKAAERRWIADRPARIAPLCEGDYASRDHRARAAAGARDPGPESPGIMGRAVKGRLRGRGHAEFRAGRASDIDQSASSEARPIGLVMSRLETLGQPAAELGRPPPLYRKILGQNGNSAEWSFGPLLRKRVQSVSIEFDHGVQGRVQRSYGFGYAGAELSRHHFATGEK